MGFPSNPINCIQSSLGGCGIVNKNTNPYSESIEITSNVAP